MTWESLLAAANQARWNAVLAIRDNDPSSAAEFDLDADRYMKAIKVEVMSEPFEGEAT